MNIAGVDKQTARAPSQRRNRRLQIIFSYAFLAAASVLVLFPLVFLLNGSFQPGWQINANPIVWLPQEWEQTPAGNTGRSLLLWKVHTDGGEQKVISIGSRRYTSVIPLSAVTPDALSSVPRAQLGEAKPALVGEVPLNVRGLKTPDGRSRSVVAVARDSNQDDNLIILDTAALGEAVQQLPLDLVNKAKGETAAVGEFELQARKVDTGEGGMQSALVVGPERELFVVGSPDIAARASLIQSSRLGKREPLQVGRTELSKYPVEGEPADHRVVVIAQEKWQPLIDQEVVAEYGILARANELSGEKQVKQFNGLNMTMQTYTPSEGGDPIEVAVLVPGSSEFLVMPTTQLERLRPGPISQLDSPSSVDLGTLTYRMKEDYEESGGLSRVAFVGDVQDLALVVPADAVRDAFDVRPEALQRATHFALNTKGYQTVLNLKLSGTPFYMFFVNSGILVLLNIVGHLAACTLVAYGFARLRAPGKNLLFLVLLGTMMIPATILVLPTYLVFRDLGMLGTNLPLWIRSFFGNAFLIFVLRQFFMTIPTELDEAAVLDGANRLQILLRVIVPLSKPALATLAIFTFWWNWNSFLEPLIYISSQRLFTVTLALNSFNQQYARSAGYYDRILAGSVLSLLPMVLIFLFAQRYFVEGIQLQGLKQ